MIPGLETRLLEGTNEDVAHIGELVRGVSSAQYMVTDAATDTKRFLQRKVRRYQESERGDFGLDYTSWPALEPTVVS
jgi:hypothetical protein